MGKTEVLLWVFSIVVPVTALVIGLLLMKKDKFTPGESDDTMAGQHLKPHVPTTGCSAEKMPCQMTTPGSCEQCGDDWVCTHVDSNDTDHDIEGDYCLPVKPSSACAHAPTNPTERMQGQFKWTGWSGVNVQDWECSCPYPRFYPMDTTPDSLTHGACKRSSALCRHGTWNYPCVRKDGTTCEELSDEETAALVGSDPLQYGMCSCENVPCNDDDDCAGNCVDGVCVGQRLGMNTINGLPECMVDTCTARVMCGPGTPCPGGALCVSGVCSESTSSCDTDTDCGVSGTCTSSKCSWGKWKALETPPYVFGLCECPNGCESIGSVCLCTPPPPVICIDVGTFRIHLVTGSHDIVLDATMVFTDSEYIITYQNTFEESTTNITFSPTFDGVNLTYVVTKEGTLVDAQQATLENAITTDSGVCIPRKVEWTNKFLQLLEFGV